MYKLLFIVIAVIVAGGYYFLPKTQLPKSDILKATEKSALPSHTVNESESIGKPLKISIPNIQVDASIESVGMDKEGRMDVPKNVNNVAWYNLGYLPGSEGSAVISGHYDTSTGAPAVFYNVAKLTSGDEIIIEDSEGKKYTFIVYDKKEFPYDNLPLNDIFATPGSPALNLITCAGEWNKNDKNYSMRTVVYSRLQK